MLGASIIIPTYCPNKIRYGFCQQSFSEIHNTGIPRKDYELIVIDNGGLHRDLIDKLDADIVLTSSHNIGQAAALNAGIGVALSNALVIAHDDMSYQEGWLRDGFQVLRKHRGNFVVLSGYNKKYVIGEAGKKSVYLRTMGGVAIFGRELFNDVGRFGVVYYSHGGLWIRNLLRKKYKIVASIKPPLITHLGRGKSIMAYNRNIIHEYRNTRST